VEKACYICFDDVPIENISCKLMQRDIEIRPTWGIGERIILI